MAGDNLGVPLADLRPTQITVGFREVERKREKWRKSDKKKRIDLLRRHVIPAVMGLKNHIYIIDHHHFAKALLDEGAPYVAIYLADNLSTLQKDEFWSFLDNNAWCHAYDESGIRRGLSDIPKNLKNLRDDPFRSLVGELIRAGACAKADKQFFEFLWADFLRRRLDLELVKKDFAAALMKAMELASSSEAKSLPGWCARST